jgi:hypothetical protein
MLKEMKNMKIHTESILLDIPKDKAFAYITGYDNIPKWSVNFIHKLEKSNDGYIATTPVGRMRFEIMADKDTGVIDLLLDSKPLPTRVVALGPKTLYLFTLILPPDLPEEEFQGGIRGLQEELLLLKEQLEK